MQGKTEENDTPMMTQWKACKAEAPAALLLFRLGDFYEAFYEDAARCAEVLEIALTQRQGVPMAGVPYHQLEPHLEKLVEAGHQVAIAEQTEKPQAGTKLLRREVVRVVSAGTLLNSALLQEPAHRYLLSICEAKGEWGLAACDLSCSDLRLWTLPNWTATLDEIARLKPAELIFPEALPATHQAELKEYQKCHLHTKGRHLFDPKMGERILARHLRVAHLDGFGLRGKEAALGAGGALIHYLEREIRADLSHLQQLLYEEKRNALGLDRTTLHHLEILHPQRAEGKGETLYSHLNATRTPMGGRLLAEWLSRPLLDREGIFQRQEGVAALLAMPFIRSQIGEALGEIRDVERLTQRISGGYASPRDLLTLACSLQQLPTLLELLQNLEPPLLREGAEVLAECPPLGEKLKAALSEAPPLRIGEGEVIRDGFDSEIDRLRLFKKEQKGWLAAYQQRLREEEGIRTARLGHHRTFGYYIEVSKGVAQQMPSEYQRRQTLVNCERFTSPELSDFEHQMMTAEEELQERERLIYDTLLHEVKENRVILFRVAHALGRLDLLMSLATVAERYDYVRPTISEGERLFLKGATHPILSAKMAHFIPNDLLLDREEGAMILLTGPNMGGKSTYLRMAALIVIMGQMGGYVPAKEAEIPLVDQIFTRIGASDELSRGRSTFMVEMTETAQILRQATSRSLLLLDEIGRGTTTYDGIAIARAVAEFLADPEGPCPKTLFATHYEELTSLEKQMRGVRNFHLLVHEENQQVRFLYRVAPGRAHRSYAIQVAAAAGLPPKVIQRARTLLTQLEGKRPSPSRRALSSKKDEAQMELLALSGVGGCF